MFSVSAAKPTTSCGLFLLWATDDIISGFSSHEDPNETLTGSISYTMGARIFEKHFTVNRSWKGTDQSFSLEPAGLSKLVRNLKRIPLLLGSRNKKFLESEKKPIFKMRKSIVAAKDLKKDHEIKKMP